MHVVHIALRIAIQKGLRDRMQPQQGYGGMSRLPAMKAHGIFLTAENRHGHRVPRRLLIIPPVRAKSCQLVLSPRRWRIPPGERGTYGGGACKRRGHTLVNHRIRPPSKGNTPYQVQDKQLIHASYALLILTDDREEESPRQRPIQHDRALMNSHRRMRRMRSFPRPSPSSSSSTKLRPVCLLQLSPGGKQVARRRRSL